MDAPPYTLQTGWSEAQALAWQGTLRQPLFAAPATEYCYCNANFHLAGYVVEKAWASLGPCQSSPEPSLHCLG